MKILLISYIVITSVNFTLQYITKIKLNPWTLFLDIVPFLNVATMTAYLEQLII